MSGADAVIVVHRDRAVLDVLAECLADAGYQVSAARDTGEAMRLIERHSPAALLVDLQLDGPTPDWSLVRSLRERTSHDLPIIALTTQQQTDEQRFERCNARAGVVVLPCDLDVVLGELSRLIQSAPRTESDQADPR
jgi:DNA-binding response OmpR family regulator